MTLGLLCSGQGLQSAQMFSLTGGESLLHPDAIECAKQRLGAGEGRGDRGGHDSGGRDSGGCDWNRHGDRHQGGLRTFPPYLCDAQHRQLATREQIGENRQDSDGHQRQDETGRYAHPPGC